MVRREPYTARLRRHLVAYKHRRLGIHVTGTFRHKGREIAHAHILPRELKWLNVLEPIRAEVRTHVLSNKLTLHKYFHHLNSSQALTFNLFFPYFAGGAKTAERVATVVAGGGDAAQWCFEHVPFQKEGTSVDVAWFGADMSPTYCEVKLSEGDFGKAAKDARHVAKLDNTYRRSLAPFVSPALLETTAFLSNYQILRNLWLATLDARARVIFLLPSANERLWPVLRGVLEGVSSPLRQRVKVVSLETVVAALVADRGSDARLRLHAEMVHEKYVIRSSAP